MIVSLCHKGNTAAQQTGKRPGTESRDLTKISYLAQYIIKRLSLAQFEILRCSAG